MLGLGRAIPEVSGSILGAILGVWKARLGGYILHLGPWADHVAVLGGHFVAKRVAKNQQEQPETRFGW